MQRVDHREQKLLASLSRQVGPLNEFRQLAACRVVGRRFGQSQQDPIENLAGRFASERGGENLVNRRTVRRQCDKPIGKLKGLARSRGRTNHNVGELAHGAPLLRGSSRN